jgi:glucan biosynthesis protein C
MLSVILFTSLLPLYSQNGAVGHLLQLWTGVYCVNACALLLWISKRFFDQRREAIASLSEASYTVYLLHWPIMVVLYRLIPSTALPVAVVFAILVCVTSLLSYLAHVHLVKKFAILAFVLNGQRFSAALSSPTFHRLMKKSVP